MYNAAIYSRKSKFTGKGESIENQVEMCKQYGRNIGIDTFEIYEDEGFSAKNTDRPEFQRLMRDIKKKKFTHLICYRLDRINRNVADFSNTLEILNKYDISFVSIKEQFDTSNAMGRAMMNISAVFAQLERETTAERIRDNLRELAKTGRWLGGPPPVGYKSVKIENQDNIGKNRNKHILDIDSNEIHIPSLVFDLFLKHKSYQRVSRILESQGIYSRKGSLFSRELVKQLINNPVYCIADKKIMSFLKDNGADIYGIENINGSNGLMPYNRRTEKGSFAPIEEWIVSVGDHPGIVPSNVWIECQQIAMDIKEKASDRSGTSQSALLSGLVVCAECGFGMAPKINNSGKYTYRYYSCNQRNKSANRCQNDALNAYDAEDYIVKKLKNVTKEDIINNYSKLKSTKFTIQNNKNNIKELEKEIETNKKLVSNLVTKIAFLDNDPILLEPFKTEIKKLTEKNKFLTEQIEKINFQINRLDDSEESLENLLNIFDNFKNFFDFTDDFEEKKRLIRSVIKFIVWDSKTRQLDVVLVGSSKQRPNPNNLRLEDSNRRACPCGSNGYNGTSNYGKCLY